METVLSTLYSLISVLLLVLANGFFVAAEFAIVRSRPTHLKSPENQGRFGVKPALRLIEHLDDSLSATQLGITIASLVLGWWGEEVFQKFFIRFFEVLGPRASLLLSHATATVAALIIITFLHVVLGELAAKSVAIRHPEVTLRLLAGPMLLFTRVCRPIVWTLATCANLFLRLFGITAPAESERVLSSTELAMLVSQSGERGILDKDEEEMLHGVFGFSETVAREVMTPRTDVVVVPLSASFKEAIRIATTSGLSRFPVIGETIDDVKGVLLARDLLAFVGRNDFAVRKVLRDAFFIPGTKSIDDLLNEFKTRKLHMAVVLDEHGGVDGVVTLEDLLEEIVGDIFDESDVAEHDLVEHADGDLIVDGGVLVDDLNGRSGSVIPEGEYDTVAGFVLDTLERMPSEGDRIFIVDDAQLVVVDSDRPLPGNGSYGDADAGPGVEPVGYRAMIRVEQVKGHRIESVRVHFPAVTGGSAESQPEAGASDQNAELSAAKS